MIIITGTSSGIGFALAQLYLQTGEEVIGIGRRNTIVHPRYQHLSCDLSKADEVEQLILPPLSGNSIFIHNAGILGEVRHFTQQSASNLQNVMQVNLFSGTCLVQKLLTQTALNEPLQVVFISSGAGKRAIPSWSAYCASKAAVDLWLQTIYLEEIEKGRTHFGCYTIAPGVVDTPMQAHIRTVAPSDFSSLQHFIALKAEEQLISPEEAARKITLILQFPFSAQIQWNLREVNG